MRSRVSESVRLGCCRAPSRADVSGTVAKALPCQSCANVSETVAKAFSVQKLCGHIGRTDRETAAKIGGISAAQIGKR